MADKNKRGGENTEYKPEYCQEMIDFFEKDGSTKMFKDFAKQIGKTLRCLQYWRVDFPDFKAAWEKCLNIQRVYKPEYCKQMIEFFDRPYTETKKKVWKTKQGTEFSEDIKVANDLPTFPGFARKIGVYSGTFNGWKEKYPEFREAWDRCHDIQHDMVLVNALCDRYDSQFAKFYSVNAFGMVDRAEQKVKVDETLTIVRKEYK